MGEAPVYFGHYLMVERLAGARATYRALPRSPEGAGAAVALKRLGPGALAAALPDLRHVNLAAPLALGRVGDERFVASQLVAGRSLERLLRAGPLPAAAAVAIVAAAARGVAWLQRSAPGGEQLLHRRLGPRTVLLGQAGEVTVCGLEQALAPPPRDGQHAVDEPGLRPPEQRSGQPLDARCDVYALAALVRLLLGGGVDAEAVDADLGDLLARACSPARSPRPPSAAALGGELNAWLGARGHAAGPAALRALIGARLTEDIAAADDRLDDGEPPSTISPPSRPRWLRPTPAGAPAGERSTTPPPPPPLAAWTAPSPGPGATRRGGGALARAALLLAAAATLLSAAFVGRAARSSHEASAAPAMRASAAGAATPAPLGAVLPAVERALCRSIPGRPERFSADDQRTLEAIAGGGGRSTAAAVVRALLRSDGQVSDALAAAIDEQARAPQAEPLGALAVLRRPGDTALRLQRLRVLAAEGPVSTEPLRPPAIAAVCEPQAAARAFVAGGDGSEAHAILGRYLAATPAGAPADAAGLSLLRLGAEAGEGQLVVHLRVTNPTSSALPVDLGRARILPSGQLRTVVPDFDTVAAGGVREVALRFERVPPATRLGAVVEIGGASMAAYSELLP